MRQLASLAVALTAVSIVTVGGSAGPTAGLESLSRLKAGNARFATSPEESVVITAADRAAAARAQQPFAAVLSCADSSVPAETIFRARPGELFVVRAAGNVPDRAVVASLEYAAERLHVPLVVVMGHDFCDTVRAAADTPATGTMGPNLDYLLKAIRPSVVAAKAQPEAERLRAAILENIEETLNDMLAESEILRRTGRTGQVTFVGAYYEARSGRVQFSEPLHIPGMITSASQPAVQGDGSGGR